MKKRSSQAKETIRLNDDVVSHLGHDLQCVDTASAPILYHLDLGFYSSVYMLPDEIPPGFHPTRNLSTGRYKVPPAVSLSPVVPASTRVSAYLPWAAIHP